MRQAPVATLPILEALDHPRERLFLLCIGMCRQQGEGDARPMSTAVPPLCTSRHWAARPGGLYLFSGRRR